MTPNNWSNQELVLGHLNAAIYSLQKTKLTVTDYLSQ